MSARPLIYLDYNATAPVRPAARRAALAAMEAGGNPSSVHRAGRSARARIERAREDVAALVHAAPERVVFTSGGSEANALAIIGGAAAGLFRRLIVFALEHESVRLSAEMAARRPDLELEFVGSDRSGVIDLDALRRALNLPPLTGGVPRIQSGARGGAANTESGAAPSAACGGTSPVNGGGKNALPLVCVMAANNETGVVQPLDKVRAICSQAGALMHVDAAQVAGRLPFDASAFDFVTLSAHKLGGLQGAGALVLGCGLEVEALWGGGAQEKRRRPGTEAVAAIAAFGAAAQESADEIARAKEPGAWRDGMEARLQEEVAGLTVFGREAPRLPQTSCLGAPGLSAETQVVALDLDGVAVSAGAACSSGKVTPSHVLLAMGYPDAAARSAIRVSFGWATRAEDLDAFIRIWSRIVARSQGARNAAKVGA